MRTTIFTAEGPDKGYQMQRRWPVYVGRQHLPRKKGAVTPHGPAGRHLSRSAVHETNAAMSAFQQISRDADTITVEAVRLLEGHRGVTMSHLPKGQGRMTRNVDVRGLAAPAIFASPLCTCVDCQPQSGDVDMQQAIVPEWTAAIGRWSGLGNTCTGSRPIPSRGTMTFLQPHKQQCPLQTLPVIARRCLMAKPADK